MGVGVETGVGIGVGVGEGFNATVTCELPPHPQIPSKTTAVMKNAAYDLNIAHLLDGIRSDAAEFLPDVPRKTRLSTWI
jgi:hypothetical protein